MNEGITDPSDWPVEFNSLREIDSHLRCPICKELLRAAMMLQCYHNFCSECIRRHLDKESTCPACRVSTSTAHMRRNVALDEIANNFKDCRSLLLKTVKDSLGTKNSKTPQLTRTESMEVDDIAPNHKRRRTSGRINNKAPSESSSQDIADTSMEFPSIDDDGTDDDFVMPSQESVHGHKGKNVTRSISGPVLRSRGRLSDTTTTTVPDPPTPSTPPNTSPAPSSAPSSAPSTPSKSKIRSLVACPVCQMGVPEAYANTHLDKFCFNGKKDPAYNIKFELIITQAPNVVELYERQGTTKQNVVGAVPSLSLSSSSSNGVRSPQRNSNNTNMIDFANGQSSKDGSPLQNRTKHLSLSNPVPKPALYPEPKRIPKLTYSVLNDKQLRKKLQELGLPSHGDKQLMQKRHAEYVTIFNANCDATRPQTPAQLMKAMEVWERTYEQDMQAKRKQQQELAKRQEEARNTAAANSAAASEAATGPSSQPSSQNGLTSSSSPPFVANQNNNTEVAAAVATASAFAHVLKYADEYAELVADVKRRMEADKEKKALADKQKKSEAPSPK
ncbi:E3 ubiquitin-protein ligase rad18 [Mortierella sp. AD011]|nr:E3 ubiquitin-protein ligase rad18 [Mortierella sp. AD010]KAF9397050.1 E3 ubiquitin-protein ligase rad18 [Mortierella sp. AD011]